MLILVFIYFLTITTQIVPPNSTINVLSGECSRPAGSSTFGIHTPDLIDLQFNSSLQDYTSNKNTDPPPLNCFRPRPYRQPVAVSSDCDRAEELIFLDGDPNLRLRWTERQTWWSGSCSIVLLPRSKSSVDCFTRIQIFRAAMRIKNKCVTHRYGFMGGLEEIGDLKVFNVSVFGRSTGELSVS